ncbi:hypothetical protein [Acinetobacter haemolyticus]|uniref:hypothetical protein n=1 Tax=Acinetobacter haemolyticus TaxID=29430 RepID=UPI000DE98152|nr:hypothetical protein [Acinetobacter haemolyticus]WHR59270.1 hypothetical protein PGW89_07615 [Acinetobacter haemolyticus]
MQFAAALVEYLISGIVASIWIVLVINAYIPLPLTEIKEYKEVFAVIYFPIAYIFGIYVDVVSSFLIRRLKQLYKKLLDNKIVNSIHKGLAWLIKMIFGTPKEDAYERSAEILSYSKGDLVRTMEAYVSRDRIARGMVLNSFIGAIMSAIYLQTPLRTYVSILCLILTIISVLIWVRLRRLSSTFKRVAIVQLNLRE